MKAAISPAEFIAERQAWHDPGALPDIIAALEADYAELRREAGEGHVPLAALYEIALGQCALVAGDPKTAERHARAAREHPVFGALTEEQQDAATLLHGQALFALGSLNEGDKALTDLSHRSGREAVFALIARAAIAERASLRGEPQRLLDKANAIANPDTDGAEAMVELWSASARLAQANGDQEAATSLAKKAWSLADADLPETHVSYRTAEALVVEHVVIETPERKRAASPADEAQTIGAEPESKAATNAATPRPGFMERVHAEAEEGRARARQVLGRIARFLGGMGVSPTAALGGVLLLAPLLAAILVGQYLADTRPLHHPGIDTPVAPGRAHAGAVTALAHSPKTGVLATGGTDGRVRLWDRQGALREEIALPQRHVKRVIFLAYPGDAEDSTREVLLVFATPAVVPAEVGVPETSGERSACIVTTDAPACPYLFDSLTLEPVPDEVAATVLGEQPELAYLDHVSRRETTYLGADNDVMVASDGAGTSWAIDRPGPAALLGVWRGLGTSPTIEALGSPYAQLRPGPGGLAATVTATGKVLIWQVMTDRGGNERVRLVSALGDDGSRAETLPLDIAPGDAAVLPATGRIRQLSDIVFLPGERFADGRTRLVLGGTGGAATIVDPDSGARLAQTEGQGGDGTRLALDGDALISMTPDYGLQTWDLARFDPAAEPAFLRLPLLDEKRARGKPTYSGDAVAGGGALTAVPGGLLTVSDGRLLSFTTANGRWQQVADAPETGIAALSPTGEIALVVSPNTGPEIRLYDAAALLAQPSQVPVAALSDLRRKLAEIEADLANIETRRTELQERRRSFDKTQPGITDEHVTKETLEVMREIEGLAVREVQLSRELANLRRQIEDLSSVRPADHDVLAELASAPIALAWSPDGNSLALAEPGGFLSIASRGSDIRPLPSGGPETIPALAWSSDGSLLAAIGDDAAIELLDPETGQRLARLEMPGAFGATEEAPDARLAISPDGSRLAASTPDSGLWVWDLAAIRTRIAAAGASGAPGTPVCVACVSVEFNGAGQLLTLDGAGTLRFWNPMDGAEVADGGFRLARVPVDMRLIGDARNHALMVHADGTAEILDPLTGQALAPVIEGLGSAALSVEVADGGGTVVLGDLDGTVRRVVLDRHALTAPLDLGHRLHRWLAGSATPATLAPPASPTIDRGAPSLSVPGTDPLILDLSSSLASEIAAGLLTVSSAGDDYVVVTIPLASIIEPADSRVSDEASALLDRLAAALDTTSGTLFVRGYTDAQPPQPTSQWSSNVELSQARAEAVVSALAERMSDPARLRAEGRGADDPVCQPATDPSCWPANRRIEILVPRPATTTPTDDPDLARGEQLFGRCSICHRLDTDANGVGPHLVGVVGRGVASVPGYAYSNALQSLGGAWTPERLDAYLASPRAFAPGTTMVFAGLGDPQDRRDLIAFLQAAGAPRAAAN